jgi:hypothetical protein
MKTRPIVPRERKDMLLSISAQENDWRKMGKGSTSRKEDMSRYLIGSESVADTRWKPALVLVQMFLCCWNPTRRIC